MLHVILHKQVRGWSYFYNILEKEKTGAWLDFYLGDMQVFRYIYYFVYLIQESASVRLCWNCH